MTRSQAEQIAHLLNEHNQLQTQYIGDQVLRSRAKYYPLHYQGLVFGSVAVQRWNFFLTEIKHLVVHNAFRRMGLAKKMLEAAVAIVNTPTIYATIRESNEPSIALFSAHGFNIAHKVDMGKHKLLMLMKKNDTYKPKVIDTQQVFLNLGLPGFKGLEGSGKSKNE